jgi:hypothetical protein
MKIFVGRLKRGYDELQCKVEQAEKKHSISRLNKFKNIFTNSLSKFGKVNKIKLKKINLTSVYT